MGEDNGSGRTELTFHDLRPIHASLLLQQGNDPKVVSERLGHSTAGITLHIYPHVVPSLQSEAASQLEEMLAVGWQSLGH